MSEIIKFDLICPECRGDKWKIIRPGVMRCAVCLDAWNKHNEFTLGYLQGYKRGLNEAAKSVKTG